MINGSCLCGGVAYRVSGPFTLMGHCYCEQCRKASGAEYATNVTVETTNLEWLRGEELLKEYQSSPGNYRCFCGECGSPVLKRVDDKPGTVRLRSGLLEGDIGVRPAARIFTSERAAWTDVPEDVPNFEREPIPRKRRS